MKTSSHYEREDSESRNSIRRPEKPSNDALINHNSTLPETEETQVKLTLAVN